MSDNYSKGVSLERKIVKSLMRDLFDVNWGISDWSTSATSDSILNAIKEGQLLESSMVLSMLGGYLKLSILKSLHNT